MRVGPFDGEVDPGMIAIIALNPNEREIVMDGVCWTFITLNPGVLLGAATDDQLRGIKQRGSSD